MIKFLRKYHKWAGLILIVFLILFSISGVILNHRETFSSFDVSRKILPPQYKYLHWNNASLKSSIKLSTDSILVYGNIGVWLTDSEAIDFKDFNQGFPRGIDNRKIFKLLKTSHGDLLAATQFGLYKHNYVQWEKLDLPLHEKNVVELVDMKDSVLIMTRSHLLSTTDFKNFHRIKLPAPAGYDNKIGLFKTLWVIHSGEIYGNAGKLIVDAIALILVFLSLTGLIIWIKKEHLQVKHRVNKGLKFRKRHILLRKLIWNHKHELQSIRKKYKWNLKWHNKIGWITLIFVLITVFTGMFLRPPFLIAIGESRVSKIPHTELATDNAWFDILRRLIWLEEEQIFVLSSFDGFYYADKNWKEIKTFDIQAPASVMGVTVLEKSPEGLLVGSFEGLFNWNLKTSEIFDVLKNEVYIKPLKKGPPVGDFKISGYSADFDVPLVFEYSKGLLNSSSKISSFPQNMPEKITESSPLSLWNMMLEIHTGRIFEFMLGLFYILIVPLVGLATIILSISGFVVWWKFHR